MSAHDPAVDDRLSEGKLLIREGRLEDAVARLTEAIRFDPKHASAYMSRAFARRTLGDLSGAIDDHTEAIRLAPDNRTGYSCRAEVLMKLGRYESAVEDLDRATELAPKDASLYESRGRAFESLGDQEKARLDRERAIGLDRGGRRRGGSRLIADHTRRASARLSDCFSHPQAGSGGSFRRAVP